jgi:hypothetical protein
MVLTVLGLAKLNFLVGASGPKYAVFNPYHDALI